MKKKKFYKQKTFWAALALIATNAMPLFGAGVQAVHAAQVTIGALTAIFMRQGVEESKFFNE